jgi:hypothetical protein
MTTFCINGDIVLEIPKETIKQLPEQFGIFDLELMLRGPMADRGTNLVGIKEVCILGKYLDKKKIKGYNWEELGLHEDSVIGILAETDDVQQIPDRKSKPESISKKGGKKKALQQNQSEGPSNHQTEEVELADLSFDLTIISSRGIK